VQLYRHHLIYPSILRTTCTGDKCINVYILHDFLLSRNWQFLRSRVYLNYLKHIKIWDTNGFMLNLPLQLARSYIQHYLSPMRSVTTAPLPFARLSLAGTSCLFRFGYLTNTTL
jgi:hypothetical protein